MVAKGLRASNGNPASPPYSNGPYEWDQHFQPHKLNLSNLRYELVERFEHTPGINADLANATEATRVPRNRNFEVLGTNASTDDVTFSATVGGIQLQTDGADNDQVIILPHLDTNQTAWTGVKWGTENQVIWECVLRTDASIASVTIWAGLKLTNTSVVATDNDQAFFRFDGGVANWEAVTSIGGTDTETNTGVAVAANTTYYLKIEIDSDRKAHYYINNNEVYVSSALTNDVDLIPYVGVHANTAAAKTIHLVAEKISRIIYE